MQKQTLEAITERFEGVAANVLEDMIFEVEQKHRLKVTDLDVNLIPDAGVTQAAPAVEVTLTVEADPPLQKR